MATELEKCLAELNSIAKTVGPRAVTTADGVRIESRSVEELLRLQKQVALNRIARVGIKGLAISSLRQDEADC